MRNATIVVGTAITRLTYRHQRQDKSCVSAPPSISPSEAPPPAIAPKIPNAVGRSPDPSNVTVSNPKAEGASSAPNAPWNARAATSTPKDWASPPIAEATENPTRPAISVHLRPNRSVSFPPSSSRLPNDSAYAVTIHCRLSVEKPSAFWAEGIAIVTIVASSTTINCATLSSARIAHRFGSRSVEAADIRRSHCDRRRGQRPQPSPDGNTAKPGGN